MVEGSYRCNKCAIVHYDFEWMMRHVESCDFSPVYKLTSAERAVDAAWEKNR